jgi:hypothetical protein
MLRFQGSPEEAIRRLGSEFMPPLDEGTPFYMPSTNARDLNRGRAEAAPGE